MIKSTAVKFTLSVRFAATDTKGLDHCLEALRTSMMCHPDLTPNNYFWSHDERHEISVGPDVPRECVDWSRVQDFMYSRQYDANDMVR